MNSQRGIITNHRVELHDILIPCFCGSSIDLSIVGGWQGCRVRGTAKAEHLFVKLREVKHKKIKMKSWNTKC